MPPVRCVADALPVTKPTVSTVKVESLGTSTADVTAVLTTRGGRFVTEQGFVLKTSNVVPTAADTHLAMSLAGDNFGTKLEGLIEGPTYYVWAYASYSIPSGEMKVYSPMAKSFKICPPAIAVNHTTADGVSAGNGPITYQVISSDVTGVAKCWITRNLGATKDESQITVSDNTPEAAGWYWQFNRKQAYARTGSRTNWASSISESLDWSAANDPCTILLGSGWHVPTYTDWLNADNLQNWATATDAYNAVLKLHNAGYLDGGGVMREPGVSGHYWSSSSASTGSAWELATGLGSTRSLGKTTGFSVRCVKD